jgi:hypothetical protein
MEEELQKSAQREILGHLSNRCMHQMYYNAPSRYITIAKIIFSYGMTCFSPSYDQLKGLYCTDRQAVNILLQLKL